MAENTTHLDNGELLKALLFAMEADDQDFDLATFIERLPRDAAKHRQAMAALSLITARRLLKVERKLAADHDDGNRYHRTFSIGLTIVAAMSAVALAQTIGDNTLITFGSGIAATTAGLLLQLYVKG